jgi:AraC-like DNA-binding protein
MSTAELPFEHEPTRPTRDPTSLSSWSLAIARALEGRGFDAAALFARAGLSFAALDDPEARYPVRATARLWELVDEATGDPAFGIEVARHTSPTTFHALGFSLAASSSLREAFERVVRYYRLVSDGATIRFADRGDHYRVSVTTHGPTPAARGSMDAVVAVAVRLCRSLMDRRFSPVRVELGRPMPPDPSAFYRFFRAPVFFDAAEDALVLDKRACEARIQGANTELARANDLIAAQAIERWDRSRMTDRVRVLLVDRLPNGAPSQLDVARALGTSTRALQRRLASEGTTYVQLLDDTRRGLAVAYLGESRHSMTDIAYLLGFSGAASFTRAFRRWTGRSPSEHRRGAPDIDPFET